MTANSRSVGLWLTAYRQQDFHRSIAQLTVRQFMRDRSIVARSTDRCAIERSLRDRPIAAPTSDRPIAQRDRSIAQIGRSRITHTLKMLDISCQQRLPKFQPAGTIFQHMPEFGHRVAGIWLNRPTNFKHAGDCGAITCGAIVYQNLQERNSSNKILSHKKFTCIIVFVWRVFVWFNLQRDWRKKYRKSNFNTLDNSVIFVNIPTGSDAQVRAAGTRGTKYAFCNAIHTEESWKHSTSVGGWN